MFYIDASYHCMQFQGKLINQTENNGKRIVLGPILALLVHIWAQKNGVMDLTSMLEIIASPHCIRFLGKLMNQT